MSTIGRVYAGPRRNWQEMCDVCGVMYNRHELVGPNQDGHLLCPDDRDGRCTLDLDAIRAGDVSEATVVRGKTREY